MTWTKEYGSFYQRNARGMIVRMTDDLGLVLGETSDGWCVLRTGSIATATETYGTMTGQTQRVGGLFERIVLVTSVDWDVDIFNRLITHSGMIGPWLEEVGLIAPDKEKP